MICFMVVVLVMFTPQRPIALVRIFLHGWGPFKLGVIPDEGEQPVVGDVKRGELGGGGGGGGGGGIFFLFWLFLGALLALILTSFLFRLALCGSFAALGSYHYHL